MLALALVPPSPNVKFDHIGLHCEKLKLPHSEIEKSYKAAKSQVNSR